MPGTQGKLTINSIGFEVISDGDWTEMIAKVKNEIIRTTGKGALSQVLQIPEVSNVQILTLAGDRGILKAMVESKDWLDMSYRDNEGNKYSGSGKCNIEGRTTKDGVTTLTLLPRDDWTETLA